MTGRVKRWLRRGALAFLLLVLWILATAWSIWTFDAASPESADVALVLGASTWNGRPSPVYEERIRHGIDLYRAGRVRFVLFSGGTGAGEPVSLAEAGRRYALAEGVPEEAILQEPDSRVTRENLAWSQRVAEERGLETFLIVSDPLHLKRAMEMADDRGMTAWPSATPTTRFRSLETRLDFLVKETRNLIQYWLFSRFLPVDPPADAPSTRPRPTAAADGRSAAAG